MYSTGRLRLYVDHSPFGVASTIAQEHQVPDSTDKAWRPVFYTSRALTKTEQNYSKVEGESLGVLTGILTNKRYLYRRHFDVIVDHQPLVSLYNVKKEAPVRVAKHKSKLRSFSFTVQGAVRAR